MNPDFIAKPPLTFVPGLGGGLRRHIWRSFLRIPQLLLRAFTPFEPRPEEPQPLPQPEAEIHEKQVEQSQWVYDQAEDRRAQLEQKAQWTFGLITFLVPLLASTFVFFIRQPNPYTISHVIVIGLLVVSAFFLLSGFISAVRAISVKTKRDLIPGGGGRSRQRAISEIRSGVSRAWFTLLCLDEYGDK